MAVVLLGTPVTTFAYVPSAPQFEIDTSTGYIKSVTGAESLTEITIPKQVGATDVKGVDPGVFDDCTSLAKFAVETDHPYLSVGSSGELLGREGTTGDFNILYRLPPAFAGEYELPDTVTRIMDGAFTNCSQLTTFNLGSGSAALTWSDFSFVGCSALASFAGSRPWADRADFTLATDGGCLQYTQWVEYTGTYAGLVRLPPAGLRALDAPRWLVNAGSELCLEPLAGAFTAARPLLLAPTWETFMVGALPSSVGAAPLLVPFGPLSGPTCAAHLVYSAGTPSDGVTPLTITAFSPKTAGDTITLCPDTFKEDGYTLELDTSESLAVVTLAHTYGTDHKCTACGADAPVVSVTDVTLDRETLELEVGKTSNLTATVEPVDATNKTVTWSSSDETVAAVSGDGLVTAMGSGSASITVTTEDGGFTYTCTVTVTQPVTGVSLSDTTKSLSVGEAITLTAEVYPQDATNKNVTWTSSNEDVATVDAAGVVTAVAPGSATITVTTADGDFTDTCTVTVTQPVGDDTPDGPDDPGDLPPIDRSSWGTPYVRDADGVTQYVVEDPTSPDFGMTSVEFTTASLSPAGADSPMFWVHESSGGSSAWYGILAHLLAHLGPGYRFYVQWLSPGDPGYAARFAQLDDAAKQRVEDDNGWLFNMGVRAPDGTDVHYLVADDVFVKHPIVYVQIGDDWDVDDLNAYYIASGADENVPVDYLMIDYPEGTDIFGRLTLDHFSPYFIFDELTDAEKAALGNGDGKTGDLATQLLISGLSIVLVSSLGVMLRLITNKRKFEE